MAQLGQNSMTGDSDLRRRAEELIRQMEAASGSQSPIALVPEMNQRTGKTQNVYQNQAPSPLGSQPAPEPDYPDYGLSDIINRPVHNPDSLDYQDKIGALYPLAMEEDRRRAKKAVLETEQQKLRQPMLVPKGGLVTEGTGKVLAANREPEPITVLSPGEVALQGGNEIGRGPEIPALTPYQQRQIELAEQRLADARNKKPTISVAAKAKADQANVVLAEGKKLLDEIAAAQKILGPMAGRIATMEAGIGSSNPQVRELFTHLKSFAALQPALHGSRGIGMQKEFESAVGTLAQNPGALASSIQSLMGTAQSFANAGKEQATGIRIKDPATGRTGTYQGTAEEAQDEGYEVIE